MQYQCGDNIIIAIDYLAGFHSYTHVRAVDGCDVNPGLVQLNKNAKMTNES